MPWEEHAGVTPRPFSLKASPLHGEVADQSRGGRPGAFMAQALPPTGCKVPTQQALPPSPQAVPPVNKAHHMVARVKAWLEDLEHTEELPCTVPIMLQVGLRLLVGARFMAQGLGVAAQGEGLGSRSGSGSGSGLG